MEAGLPSMSLYTPASTNKYGSQPNYIYNTGSIGGSINNIITTASFCTNKLYIKDDNNIVGNSSTVTPLSESCKFYISY